MNESEIKEAFSSKLLVPLAREQPDETVLSIPSYFFLGCPFDVTVRFAGARSIGKTLMARKLEHRVDTPSRLYDDLA